MVLLQWLIFSVSATLQVCLISALRRRAYKEYPFVYAYSLFLFLKILVDAALFAGAVSLSKPAMAYYWYRSEAITQFILFSLVVSLIEGAMKRSAYRERVRVLLAVTAVVSVFVSLVIHWDPSQFVLWMTEVTRDLNFGSALLTLLLWMMLISSPRRNRQVLMLTVGLGLQFTGEAIGQSLRQLAHHRSSGTAFAGNLLLSMSHLIRLYVWWEAFRRPYGQDKQESGGEPQVLPRQAETLFQSNG
jgi:hypothetical protein